MNGASNSFVSASRHPAQLGAGVGRRERGLGSLGARIRPWSATYLPSG